MGIQISLRLSFLFLFQSCLSGAPHNVLCWPYFFYLPARHWLGKTCFELTLMSATVGVRGMVVVANGVLRILELTVLSMLKMETVQPKASQDLAMTFHGFTLNSTVTL